MTTAKRQTAGNNLFLARIKAAFNAPIYEKVRLAMEEGGETQARRIACCFAYTADCDLDGFLARTIDSGYQGKRDRLPRLCR